MGKKKNPTNEPAGSGPITDKKAKEMPVRSRLLALRIAVRQRKEEGKRLNGRVSEAKTDFENTLKQAVPDDGEEAKARLRDLQLKHEEVQSRKDKRSGFKSVCKATETALLFAEVTEGGQVLLPGVELDMTPEIVRHLKTGTAAVRVADKAAEESEDEATGYPIEDAGDLSDFEAELAQFITDAGLSSASLGAAEDTAKGGEIVEMKSGRGRKSKDEHSSPVH